MNISLFISVLSLVLCVLMFIFFKWYIKRRTATEQLLAQYRTEVHRLIAEINVITDRDSQLVEERIKTLKSILEDTDKRIAVYLRDLDRSRSGEALYTSLGRGIRAALNTQPETPAVQSPSAATPVTHAPLVAAPQAESPPAAPPVEALPHTALQPEAPPPSRQQIRVQIANLAAEGLSQSEIASRLDISLSEVDLALNLISR